MSPIGYPLPAVQDDIAFIGVYHGEGPGRLEKLFRSVRPWFPQLVVAMQGPTGEELQVARAIADVVIEHPVMGYCEWSFNDLYAAVRETGLSWTFNLDGDELADPELLATLGACIADPATQRNGGARFPRRNVFLAPDGTLVPGFAEETIRLLTSEAVREPVLHGHSRGTKGRPLLWPHGSIWQFRTFREFLDDHARYLRIAREKEDVASIDITMEYLAAGYRSMLTVFPASRVRPWVPVELLIVIDDVMHPEGTW